MSSGQRQSGHQEDEVMVSDRDEDFLDDMYPQLRLNFISHKDFYKKSLDQNQNQEEMEKEKQHQSQEHSEDHNQFLSLNKEGPKYPVFEELRDSNLIINSIINQIVRLGEKLIRDHYIEKIYKDDAIQRTLNLNTTYARLFMVMPDTDEFNDVQLQQQEDIEPEKPERETWIRHQADIEKLQIDQVVDNSVKNNNNALDTSKSQLQDRTPKSSRAGLSQYGNFGLKKKKKNDIPEPAHIEPHEPISIAEPFVEDKEIEQKRYWKNEQWKRKNEQEQQEKQDQINQMKARTELRKDLKSKFTYDFNGNVIPLKGLKIEKLPPSHHNMNYNTNNGEDPIFRDGFKPDTTVYTADQTRNVFQQKNTKLQDKLQQQQQDQDKNNNTENSQRNPLLRKGTQSMDVQPIKLQPNPKMPMNEFLPAKGVTLHYQQQVKEGPRQIQSIQTFEDLEFKIKSLAPDECLQISRQEYQRLTEKGNLITNIQKASNRNSQTNILNQMDTQTSNLIAKNQFGQITEEQSSFQQQNRSFHKALAAKQQEQANFDIRNQKLHRNLKVTREDEEKYEEQIKNLLKQQQQQQQQQNMNSSQSQKNLLKKKQSPNDNFNLTIMQSADWGKQKGGMNFLPRIPKSNKQNLQMMSQTLNTIYKLPRERNQGQGLQVQKAVQENTQKLNRKNSQPRNTYEEEIIKNQLMAQKNPYNFRGTFQSTHTKFTDSLRQTRY